MIFLAKITAIIIRQFCIIVLNYQQFSKIRRCAGVCKLKLAAFLAAFEKKDVVLQIFVEQLAILITPSYFCTEKLSYAAEKCT